jgi:hypothetical protein
MIIHTDRIYECDTGRSEMSLAATAQSRIQVWTAPGASGDKLSGLHYSIFHTSLMESEIHRELNKYDVIQLSPGVMVINW